MKMRRIITLIIDYFIKMIKKLRKDRYRKIVRIIINNVRQ